jgi:hypothetical protein
MIRLLLDHGVDVREIDAAWSLLVTAISTGASLEVIRLLITYGAKPSSTARGLGGKLDNPIALAKEMSRNDVLAVLNESEPT